MMCAVGGVISQIVQKIFLTEDPAKGGGCIIIIIIIMNNN
jgi:hypothetical protein